jgi:tetratricopeptide (TPR) repeat protein
MSQEFGLIRAAIVVTVASCLPTIASAHGGPGGGHGAGMGGGRGDSSGARAYAGGGGYRGPAAYRGHIAGYHGYGPGYRWGYPAYGWGYPYYGYGLGLGLGLGYGLGAGYGYGYPAYGAYYGGSYYTSNTGVVSTPVTTSVVTTANAARDDMPTANARAFIERGEAAFKAGRYDEAVYEWRHAIVDAHQDPILVLQLAQALFAVGKYEEAAGATQSAMRQLPDQEWGSVVRRYQELYGNSHHYTEQLKSLEKAIKNKPNDPALRFLAGYHYGYLGFFKQSIAQFDKVLEIEPRDEIAKKLRDEMRSQLVNAEIPPAAPAPIPALQAP